MARICSSRQFLFCSLIIFCFLMTFMTAALFRYRLEARDPLPTSIPSRLLQHTLPIAPPDPVDAAGQGAVHEFKAHHPPLTAPGSNYGLSHTECRAEFPRLFDDLDRSVALRRELGNVSLADVDLAWKPHGAVRVMIYNHRLYIIEAKFNGKGYQRPRLLATLNQLNRAITSSPFPLPAIEFSFSVTDIPDKSHEHHPIWTFSRHVSRDREMWLMPDFGYWSWPLDLVGEYQQIRSAMNSSEVNWDSKIPKVLWRGAVKTNEEVRGGLMRVARGKPWADVDQVTWKSRVDVTAGSAAVSIPDHCKYQFLVHTEGRSYSGRGKYLLNCASVVIMHKPEWTEPHSHLYIPSGPNQNIVEVERDFSDLEPKVLDLLQNPERARAIAANSAATFRDRYLAPAAEACYWRELFTAWAGVSFTPEPWEVGEDGRERVRGVPFETFMIQAFDANSCAWWKKVVLMC